MAVIFDLDGTLIDSAPELHKAANALLAEEGLAPQSREQVTSFVGEGARVLTQRVMQAAGQSPDDAALDALTQRLVAHYAALPAGASALYPGVAAELARLAGLGHLMGLCTNKPLAPTQAILSAHGLGHRFGAVVGGDSLGVRKPDPAPLLEAAARLGSDRAVMVGDSEIDAETAERAGAPFILFTRGYRKGPAAAIPHDAAFDDWARFGDALRRVYI